MKIIPLHSAEPTTLKLTKFEWGISALFALLIPLFFQSLLVLAGYQTRLPIFIALVVVGIVDTLLIIAKSKEQDFFRTLIHNFRIPNVVRGLFPTLFPTAIPGGLEKRTP